MTILSVYAYVNGDFMKKINILHIYQITFLFLNAPLLLASQNIDLDSRLNIKTVAVSAVNSINTDMDVSTDTVEQPNTNAESVNVDMGLVKANPLYNGPSDPRFFTEFPDEVLMFFLSFLDMRSAAMVTSINRNLWRIRRDRKFLYLRSSHYLETVLLARFAGLGPAIATKIDQTLRLSYNPGLRERLMSLAQGLQYKWRGREVPEVMVRNWKVVYGALTVVSRLGEGSALDVRREKRGLIESALDAASCYEYTDPSYLLLTHNILLRQFSYCNRWSFHAKLKIVGKEVQSQAAAAEHRASISHMADFFKLGLL